MGPVHAQEGDEHGNRGYAGAIGRLKPNVTVAMAQRDLDAIMERLAREIPKDNEGWRSNVMSMRDDLVGSLQKPLEVFAAAVVLVLLIACANVANLTSPGLRGGARSRFTALGAGRGRIIRQLVTESIVLAALGGIRRHHHGVRVRLLRLGFPDYVPYYIPIGVNVPTLLFAALVALWLAWRSASSGLPVNRRFRRAGAARGRKRWQRRTGTQPACQRDRRRRAGALGDADDRRGLAREELSAALDDEARVRGERHSLVSVTLPTAKYETPALRSAFYETENRFLSPSGGRFGRTGAGDSVQRVERAVGHYGEGLPPPKPEEFVTHYQYVSPTFFQTMGVGLQRGRWLTDADRDTINVVGLVNATFARRVFPNEDPIGKQVRRGDAVLEEPLGDDRRSHSGRIVTTDCRSRWGRGRISRRPSGLRVRRPW